MRFLLSLCIAALTFTCSAETRYWDASTTPGVTSYMLQWQPDGATEWESAVTSELSYELPELPDGVYRARVRALAAGLPCTSDPDPCVDSVWEPPDPHFGFTIGQAPSTEPTSNYTPGWLSFEYVVEPEPPMALSFSVLTSGTVTSEPAVTASISPAANSLIIVAAAAATTAGPSTPTTSVTGFSATWSATSQAYGSRRALSVSTALMSASPGSGTLTLDTSVSGNPFAEMKYVVLQVSGVDTDTPVGTKYTGVQAGGTSLSVTVSDVPDSGDMVFAVFAIEGGSVSPALNSELDNTLQDSGGGSHVRTLVAAYDSAPDGSPTPGITWTGTESAGGIAFVVNVEPGGSVELVVADSSHSNSVDAVALTQANVLALADTAHANEVDNLGIIQASLLGVAETSHTNIPDNLTLIPTYSLSLSDTEHTNLVDGSLALVQANTVSIADTDHTNIVESPTLSQALLLVVAESNQTHSVENLALVQANTVSMDDTLHTNSAELLSLTQQNTLVVVDTSHAHEADPISLTGQNELAVAETSHDHGADPVSLTQQNIVAIVDALHAHNTESVSLTQQNTLSVAATLHEHNSDNVTISPSLELVLAETSHTNLAEEIELSVDALLSVSEVLHINTTDQTELTQAHSLAIQEALHSHSVDAINLNELILSLNDTLHTHTVTGFRLYLLVTGHPSRKVKMVADNRQVGIVKDSRIVKRLADIRSVKYH